MTDTYDVVIVGAGHGGAQTAIALRQQGYAGTIALVGDEPYLPYERPPLSKEYLAGEKTFERILIRPAGFWQERDVTMRLGHGVTAVDPLGRRLTLRDGATIGYGVLVWATGGTARRLTCDGHALDGVHAVRGRADVDRLAQELTQQTRVVVVGGGYIGLEAAAVLSKRGLPVTVLEAQPRVLARVAGEALSDFFASEHRAHGVDLRLGVGVASLIGDGRVDGVRLVDGETIAADVVIVGIGIEPAVAPLLAAGAAGGNGVRVDDQCRTSLPHVYAVGDCALHANPYADGREIRLESVQNANDMAQTAARTIAGTPHRYDAVPWFWSSQYDLKLQTVGLSSGHDQALVRGDPAARSFSVVYLHKGRVVALDCVNAVKDYVQGRKLVEARACVPVAALADPATPLKSLLPEASSG